MKKIKLITILFFISLSYLSISQTKEVVYIRIQEVITGNAGPGAFDSYMSIVYPDQPPKYVELSKLGLRGKAAEENGKKIQAEIAELLNKRYEVAAVSVEKAREQAIQQELYLQRVVNPNMPVKALYPERLRILATVLVSLLLVYSIGWLIVAGVREHAA